MEKSLSKGTEIPLEIEGLSFGGDGVARSGGMVVFVHGGVPGDTVLAVITKQRKNYCEANIVSVEKPSLYRISPRCGHFGVCGGCRLQHIIYDRQLFFKESHVRECLEHIGGMREVPVREIIRMQTPWFYRNKMEFTFGMAKDGEVVIGLHEAGRFDRVVDIVECFLQSPLSNSMLAAVRDFARRDNLRAYNPRAWRNLPDGSKYENPLPVQAHQAAPLLKNLVIRTGNDGRDYMVCIVTTPGDFSQVSTFKETILRDFPQVKSLFWYRNPYVSGVAIAGEGSLLYGESFVEEKICGISLKVSPASFVQVNTMQVEVLYSVVQEFAELTGDETVFDLYTGTGPIALILARAARKVVALEINADAVNDARCNAEKNGISNVEFIEGDVEKHLPAVAEKDPPDVVVVDPPRAGVHKKAMRALLKLLPRCIVYVSCNPATLARDLKVFTESGYDILGVQPIDMFPHTAHIESVARLDRRV